MIREQLSVSRRRCLTPELIRHDTFCPLDLSPETTVVTSRYMLERWPIYTHKSRLATAACMMIPLRFIHCVQRRTLEHSP
jgi:hypothetical protein